MNGNMEIRLYFALLREIGPLYNCLKTKDEDIADTN